MRKIKCFGTTYYSTAPSRMFRSAGVSYQATGSNIRTAARTGDRGVTLTQYIEKGNLAQPMPSMILYPRLSAGVYAVTYTESGLAFEKQAINTDSLLRFEDPIHREILSEMDEFWGQKDRYEKKGFLHNRAILMFGPPGSGKSCIIKLATEDLINKDDIVFVCGSIGTLTSGLQVFREVEPDRRCLAILEDVDELNEHQLLQLFDGGNTIDNIMFLATTNYIDRLPPRVLRPGRFDRKIEVPYPPAAGRLAYFKQKLQDENLPKEEMKKLVKATKGMSFGHLRELVAAVFIRGQDLDKVIKRLQGDGLERASAF